MRYKKFIFLNCFDAICSFFFISFCFLFYFNGMERELRNLLMVLRGFDGIMSR